MNRVTSLYLDLIRVSAALVVVLTHLAYTRFSGGQLLAWRSLGNDAVMVFFVLSGYVIAWSAAERELTLGHYALNRAARLYSVALPAVALTVLLDAIGRHWSPALYHGFQYQGGEPALRLLHALTFTHELWFQSWRVFSNGPYWSLGYECGYYLLFACAWYLRGVWRGISVLAGAALLGPKILLLLPVWALGVVVYRINSRHVPGVVTGFVLWAASLLAYAAFRIDGGPQALLAFSHAEWGRHFVEHSLHWSNEFLASYVIGVLVAMNFVGLNACAPLLTKQVTHFERPIRAGAACTFSIYLFHYPLLQCLAASGAFAPRSPLAVALLGLVTVALCCALATVTEKRKPWLRAVLLSGTRRLRQRLPRAGLSW
ncbi:MAG: acyltransferase [Gammaproteobacteria bacterium]|nr:acyltransferase [Gammaproteobacteria bacterium]